MGTRLLCLLLAMIIGSSVLGANVTYDGRALIIDGQRKLLFSGSIHYPRSTPDMWPSLISKAKEGGIDVIETYVFWNLHEPKQGQYDFTGRGDIVRFMKEIQAQGLYACLRIGPYIESEWNYGGLPFWLHDVPGIVYRSDNEPFKFYMKNFTTQIVNLMKSEGLYASQGGPIIISQIENEYQNIESAFREKGPPYVKWAAEMAVGLDTGVPWVMCKQDDAPDPVINTCNGMRCGETFVGPNSPNKPALWTENWTSVYEVYGNESRVRSAEDIAFHVALFIARMKGSFVNYYMYHGGTNYGRTASAYVLTSYYDQAPLDEYGMIRQPKWGHLKDLHATIKLCTKTLLYGVPSNITFGEHQEGYVFRQESGECAAFLVNNDRVEAVVQFQNASYQLPRNSISILPDCKTVAFNTAKINTQFSPRTRTPAIKFDSADGWKQVKEVIPELEATSFKSDSLLEHMNTTKDASDYLWYITRFQSNSSDEASVLSVDTRGHVLHAFVNGVLVGSGHGYQRNSIFTLEKTISLNNGENKISLLSATVGLTDSGAFLERKGAGLHTVNIIHNQQATDLTNYTWGYQVGLVGEIFKLYTDEGIVSASWKTLAFIPQPLTWYKTTFDAPGGNDPLALNLKSMGKGQVWINGQSIGRYWISFRTPSGASSQTWYHVPRSFLKPTGNQLVLFEEEVGNPLDISLDTISIVKVCGHVSDSNPPPVNLWKKDNSSENDNGDQHGRRPKVQLRCPPNSYISMIQFASFGTPSGNCNSYAIGSCHSLNSKAVVEKACMGKRKCTIPQSIQKFGGDPCPGVPKSLLVDAQCGRGLTT